VLHAAGSVKHMIAPEVWARGVAVVSAAAANADPVAEIAVAQIVLAARGVPAARRRYARERRLSASGAASARAGAPWGSSRSARSGAGSRSADSGLRVLAADPFADAAAAAEVGVELVSLEELFASADVVSLHAPLLPATTGMIDAALLRRLPEGRRSSTPRAAD
jgi:phosphoglycerate dehydrogenase-like enzyme